MSLEQRLESEHFARSDARIQDPGQLTADRRIPVTRRVAGSDKREWLDGTARHTPQGRQLTRLDQRHD
jgi:hypothetical protein